MEEKQMLELILSEIREVKATQETLVKKVDGITEQLAKVSELEPVVRKLVKDVDRLDADLILIKKFITS